MATGTSKGTYTKPTLFAQEHPGVGFYIKGDEEVQSVIKKYGHYIENNLEGPAMYGSWNLRHGLRRWRESLGMTGRLLTSPNTGFGGVDVVCIGDSIVEGGISTTYLYDPWVNRLKIKLQTKYNPSGVTGGHGFLPFVQGTTSGNWAATASNGILVTAESKFSRLGTGSNGASTRHLFASGTAGTPNHRMYVSLDPANPRGGVDYVELVAAQGAIAGNVVYDITPSQSPLAYVTTGSAGITGTIATNGASTIFGKHWGKFPGSALTPTDQHTIQLSYNTGTIAYWDGLICYNKDFDCGVRVHNLGSWGATVNSFSSSTDKLLSNIDHWGTGVLTTGATNAKLFIMDFVTNDVGTTDPPVTAIATFKTRYATLIDRALGLASKPSVLIVIPPCRNNSTSFGFYGQYVKAIYELAQARDHVAVLNLWEIADDGLYTGRVTELEWDVADGTHYSDTFQEAVANFIYEVLTS